MCTGERAISKVRIQFVSPELVKAGDKIKQRRNYLLQLATSSSDLARKCSAHKRMMHLGPTTELPAHEESTSIQAGRKGCRIVHGQKDGRITVFAASSESTRGEENLINLTSLECSSAC